MIGVEKRSTLFVRSLAFIHHVSPRLLDLKKYWPAMYTVAGLCGEISNGKRYATRDACEVDVRKQWNDLWPIAECDNRIRAEDLDLCLKAIDITTCGNALDFFNTVFNKCGKAQVCRGPSQ